MVVASKDEDLTFGHLRLIELPPAVASSGSAVESNYALGLHTRATYFCNAGAKFNSMSFKLSLFRKQAANGTSSLVLILGLKKRCRHTWMRPHQNLLQPQCFLRCLEMVKT